MELYVVYKAPFPHYPNNINLTGVHLYRFPEIEHCLLPMSGNVLRTGAEMNRIVLDNKSHVKVAHKCLQIVVVCVCMEGGGRGGVMPHKTKQDGIEENEGLT